MIDTILWLALVASTTALICWLTIQNVKLQTEVKRLTDVLLSRHGGECLALLDELDQAQGRARQAPGRGGATAGGAPRR